MSNKKHQSEAARFDADEHPGTPDAAQPVDPAASPAEADPLSATRLREQLAEAEQRVLRAQADLENFRRRSRQQAQEHAKYAAIPLLNDLLDVVDNLRRALQASQTDAAEGPLRQGVEMVADQLQAVLDKHGCQAIDPVGETFDPNIHEAVQMIPSEAPANTVVDALQIGYALHDRVIRPAKVLVSAGRAAADNETDQ